MMSVNPYGFDYASQGVLKYLHVQLGCGLWMVTWKRADQLMYQDEESKAGSIA